MPSYTYTLILIHLHIYTLVKYTAPIHIKHTLIIHCHLIHFTWLSRFRRKCFFLKRNEALLCVEWVTSFGLLDVEYLDFLNMCRFEWLIHPWFPKFWFPRWNRNVCLGDLRGLELFPAVSIFTQIVAIKSLLFTQIVGKIAESLQVIHPQASTTFDNSLLSVAVKTHTSEFCVFPVDCLGVF